MNSIVNRLEKCKNELFENIVVGKQPISTIYAIASEYKKGKEFPEKSTMHLFNVEKDWWNEKKDSHTWFYFSLKTPKAKLGVRYELLVETDKPQLNPQFLIYLNGNLAQGFDYEHRTVTLQADMEYEVYIYAYGGMNITDRFFFNACLLSCSVEVERLYDNLLVPIETMKVIPKACKEYDELAECMKNTINLIDFYAEKEEVFYRSITKANEYIEIELYDKICKKTDNIVSCIGHTHIDVAWLWSIEQAREKAQHSFANMIALLDEFPEYRFMSSQPILYEFVKEEDPNLYEAIKEKVSMGVWEAEGSMWVEPDCNLPSGESLIRQILYGKNFFKKEFGVENKIAWLPDTFGFSASIPQILKKSGVEVLAFSKMSWNEENALPDDLFLWRGNDGSEVTAYCMTAQDKTPTGVFENRTRYSGLMTPKQFYGCYDRFRNKDIINEALFPFGFGDGGGGANRSFLRTMRRLQKGLPQLPTAVSEPCLAFFTRLKQKTSKKKMPKWNGELYLELHRGVYTTLAKVKKNNRRCETALQNAEMLACLSEIYEGKTYPKAEIDAAWKKVLTNQFHDILAGTCIKEVYERTDADYESVLQACGNICESSLAEWISEGEKEENVVFNPISVCGEGTIYTNGEYRYVKDIPSKGFAAVELLPLNGSVQVKKQSIENDYFSVDFDGQGNIVGIYDKTARRQMCKHNRIINEIVSYEDKPLEFDAWEIKAYSYDRPYPVTFVSMTPFHEGARSGIVVKKQFHASYITQKICLYENIGRIDFETEIEWNESHVLLKALFPIDVVCDKVLTETQYGYMERPLQLNTKWDKTHFEVCAHKYVCLAEGNYCVGILNDCKYGYGIHNGEINLTLLRSPTYPYENADKGKHNFTYSLYPYYGTFPQSDIPAQSLRLNNPLQVKRGVLQKAGQRYSAIACSCDNVVIDTLKKSEDGKGYVVRIFENKCCRTDGILTFGFDVTEAVLCDMMERPLTSLPLKDQRNLPFSIKPFEVLTIKIQTKQGGKDERKN